MQFVRCTPWALQTSFYPMGLVLQGASRLIEPADIEIGPVRPAETLGLRQVGYRDWIAVRTPDPIESEFFHLSPDGRVFEISRTAFDQTGTPMRLTVNVYSTDRSQFIVNVGDVPAPGVSIRKSRDWACRRTA